MGWARRAARDAAQAAYRPLAPRGGWPLALSILPDSHIRREGVETVVVHEYLVTGEVRFAGQAFSSRQAETGGPAVGGMPGALATAGRLPGTTPMTCVTGSQTFVGETTCQHSQRHSAAAGRAPNMAAVVERLGEFG